jgi:hypothetical protein
MFNVLALGRRIQYYGHGLVEKVFLNRTKELEET